jgi:hypothetical protein
MKSMSRSLEVQPLPTASDEMSTQIIIEPATPHKARRDDSVGKSPQTSNQQSEAKPHKGPPAREHPIITRWIAERERHRREALASRNEWVVENAPGPITDVDRRRHSILTKLLHAIEDRGGQASETQKGNLQARIDGEVVEFQIREKQRQTRVVSNYGGHLSSKQELVGTGKLVFVILTYWPGCSGAEWRETDSIPLESKLPNMIDRLFEGAQALKLWHLEREQEEERRRRAAAERAERQREAEREQKRRQRLVELAGDWQAANVIRDLIAMLHSKGVDEDLDVAGKTMAEWLAWADGVANDLDATRNGAASFFSAIKREDP